MQKRSESQGRRGVSAVRIVMIVILLAVVGAGVFEVVQWNRRNSAEAALEKFNLNPKRDPNDPKKIIEVPEGEPATRSKIHEEVFGGAKPTETSEEGRLMLKESWAFPGVFTNYVVDVNYNLVTQNVVDPTTDEGKGQEYEYNFNNSETRNVSHFASGPLIANKVFSGVPDYSPRQAVGDGGGGGGGGGGQGGDGNRGGGGRGSRMRANDDGGDGNSDDGNSGDGNSDDGQGGDDEPPITAPPTGDGKSGDGNSGDSGSGDAGSGSSGSGSGSGGSGDGGNSDAGTSGGGQ